MEAILVIAIIAGLFYFMRKKGGGIGCCGGHSHNKRLDPSEDSGSPAKKKSCH